MNEADLSQEMRWYYEQRARRAVANLKRRNLDAQYVADRHRALPIVMDMIPEGAVVGFGDSVTLVEVGIFEALERRKGNTILNPFARDAEGHSLLEGVELVETMRQVLTSDVYLMSANAITLDGKVVNTDMVGNRVAAMIFGPKKVIVVAGANKIVKDVEEAVQRIRNVAAPINAKRHQLKHHLDFFGELPCVKTGLCIDCRHPRRICRYTVILEAGRMGENDRTSIVIVGEELGI